MTTKDCEVEGCGRPRRGPKTPLCNTHYFRVRRNGHPGPAEIWDRCPKVCSVEECQRTAVTRGMCGLHERRVRKGGSPDYVPEPRLGEKNAAWKGDKVGYGSAHERVRRLRGSASEHTCECGDSALHWAYMHDDPNELRAPEGPYSASPDHYAPMCVPCHKKMDLSRLQ